MSSALVDDIILRALAEDAPWGDITSEVFLPESARATADLVPREPGVLSGILVFTRVFELVDARCSVELLAVDGERIGAPGGGRDPSQLYGR